jgi:hypothetical protein
MTFSCASYIMEQGLTYGSYIHFRAAGREVLTPLMLQTAPGHDSKPIPFISHPHNYNSMTHISSPPYVKWQFMNVMFLYKFPKALGLLMEHVKLSLFLIFKNLASNAFGIHVLMYSQMKCNFPVTLILKLGTLPGRKMNFKARVEINNETHIHNITY